MSGNSEAPFSLEGDLFHSVEWDGEPTQVVWDDTGRVSKASIIPATIGVGAVLWVVGWLIHRSRK